MPCADLLLLRQSPLADLHPVQRRERTEQPSISEPPASLWSYWRARGWSCHCHVKVHITATGNSVTRFIALRLFTTTTVYSMHLFFLLLLQKTPKKQFWTSLENLTQKSWWVFSHVSLCLQWLTCVSEVLHETSKRSCPEGRVGFCTFPDFPDCSLGVFTKCFHPTSYSSFELFICQPHTTGQIPSPYVKAAMENRAF